MPKSTHSSLPHSSSELSSDLALRPQQKPQRKLAGPHSKPKPRGGARIVLTDSEDDSDGHGASDNDIPDNQGSVASQNTTTGTTSSSDLSKYESPVDDGSWFEIKDIIGEKTQGRRLLYLVDWADNPETGASYSPSWIPAKDASAAAVRDWKANKKAKQTAKQATKKTKKTPRAQSSSGPTEASQSTEAYQTPSPTIPRKRSFSPSDDQPQTRLIQGTPGLRRPSQSASSTDRNGPALLSSPPRSREASAESNGPSLVLLANSALSSIRNQTIAVELSPAPDFDPSEYVRFSQLDAHSQSRPPQLASSPNEPSPAPATQPQREAEPAVNSPSSAALLPESYSGPVVPDSQSEATGSLGIREAAKFSQGQISTGNGSVDDSDSQPIRFLTQLESGFDFSTQRDSPTTVAQTPNVLSECRSSHISVVPDSVIRLERTAVGQIGLPPPSLSSPSTSVAAVAAARDTTVPDSLPSAQVDQQLHSNDQDPLFTQQPSLIAQTQPTDSSAASLPKPNTPSQRSIAFSMDGDATPSAVDLLKQAQRDALGPDGLDSMEDDPLVLAEIQRMMEEERRASQSQDAGPSSAVAPLTSPAAGVAKSSPFLPQSGPSTPLASAGGTSPQPNAMASGAAADMPLFGAPGLVHPVDAEAMATEQPGEDNAIPTTVAPSDLFSAPHLSTDGLELSPEPEDFVAEEVAQIVHDVPAPLGHHDVGGHSADSPVPMDADDDADDDADSDGQSQLNPNLTTRDYLVTLPLAANSRQRYIDLVMDPKNKSTIQSFGAVFSDETVQEPDAELIGRVDELLRKLLDLADLPPFYDSLPPLSNEASTKHAVNTSCKFSFVYEFLEAISTRDKKVLILARKGTALAYLQALLRSIRVPFQRIREQSATAKDEGSPAVKNGNGDHDGSDSDIDESEGASGCSLSVILADTGVSIGALPRDVDIVIGFDHTARSSGLLAHYLDASDAATAGVVHRGGPGTSHGATALPKPLVLLLVAAYTLEHIDLRLEQNTVDDLERRNALLLCTLECLTYLQDTAFDDVPGKPHEVADAFSKLIADPTQPLSWTPTTLPADVFDIYVHAPSGQRVTFSQQESLGESVTASRKRQLLDDGQDASTAKRARIGDAVTPIVPEQSARLSDTVKQALGTGGSLLTSGPTVQISLAQLEALAAKVVARETQLHERESMDKMLAVRVRGLEKLVKESTETVNQCQRRLLEAVKDRGIFEAERDKATKEAAATRQTLETRDATVAELKAQNKRLEEQLAEANGLLAGSVQPDLQRLAEARSEAAAAAAQVQQLEKKVRSAETDLGHARRAYQDASNAAADMSSENRDLAARVQELEQRAGTNLRQIHELHQRSEAEAYRRQWEEMQTALRERERELERAREELRVLKNGRRETRAQSVPRSPRPSVLSPRTVVTSSGRVGGGSASLPPASGGGGGGGGNRSSASRGNSPVTANFDPASYSTTAMGGSLAGGGGPPMHGMPFLTPQQGGGRWGHLRD